MNAGPAMAVVAPQDHGARLDRWLTAVLGGFSRARVQSLIAAGAVTLDGRAVTEPGRRVKAGDRYAVVLPEPVEAAPVPQAMDLDVVYEDEDLIVVNKPAGLVIHPAPGNPDRTLVNALLAHCGQSLAGIGGVIRPGIVHRLDKDTSGLIVAAKTEAAHEGLSRQFAAHSITRRYDALVWGLPRPAAGTVTGAIGRSPHNRHKMAIVKRGGREAVTEYTTVATFGALAARLHCCLRTGRTHQIRVHMAARGHPLIGDPLYGSGRHASRKIDPVLAEALAAFKRQALHAGLLGFVHPTRRKTLSFEQPPPPDFEALAGLLARLA